MRHARKPQVSSFGILTGSQYATIPADFSLELIGKSRISGGGWCKFEKNAADIVSYFPHILGIRCPTNSASALQLSLLDHNRIRFGTDEGSATQNYDVTVPELRAHAWNHVYCAADLATGIVRVWLNGVLVGQSTLTFAAATFTAGAGASSYIGANGVGASGFYGSLRDLVVSFAEITDDMVWDLFTKGEFDAEAYYWSCDDSFGSTIECTKNDVSYPIFDAAVVGGSLVLWTPDVPKPIAAIPNYKGYFNVMGTNARYRFDEALYEPRSVGSPVLCLSAWIYLASTPLADSGILYIPDNIPGTALTFFVNINRQLVCGATEKNGGLDSFITSVSNHWGNVLPLNQWLFVVAEANYADKIFSLYLNGGCIRRITGIAWTENSYQATSGTWDSAVGRSTGSFPGKIANVILSRAPRGLTKKEHADWYAKDEFPIYNMETLFDFRVNNEVTAEDVGPYAIPLTPDTISFPYGPRVGLFGGVN